MQENKYLKSDTCMSLVIFTKVHMIFQSSHFFYQVKLRDIPLIKLYHGIMQLQLRPQKDSNVIDCTPKNRK